MSGGTLKVESDSARTTRQLGEDVGRLAFSGLYICLYGELGAGKTTFVQGLARGLDVRETYITSPSFALVNEYRGRFLLYHIDLYRLDSTEELEDIGFFEYPGEGVAALEWPERAGGGLPEGRLDISLRHAGPETRMLEISALGEDCERLLEELCRSSRWQRR